jgi:hypothetical protein
LLDGSGLWEDEPVLLAGRRSFAVDGLRRGDDDLFDRQVLVPDDLEHLGGAEAVDVHVLAHLGHVASVGCLVKDDVHAFERRSRGGPVADVGVNELGFRWYPGRLAVAVGLGFEVVEDADFVALVQEKAAEVRADQTRPAGYQSTLATRTVRHRLLPPEASPTLLPGKPGEDLSCSFHASHRSAVALTTRSASTLPCAMPFSKSPSMLAIWFVTCAKQTTGFFVAYANAYRAEASISTARTPAERWRSISVAVSRKGASVVQAVPRTMGMGPFSKASSSISTSAECGSLYGEGAT